MAKQYVSKYYPGYLAWAWLSLFFSVLLFVNEGEYTIRILYLIANIVWLIVGYYHYRTSGDNLKIERIIDEKGIMINPKPSETVDGEYITWDNIQSWQVIPSGRSSKDVHVTLKATDKKVIISVDSNEVLPIMREYADKKFNHYTNEGIKVLLIILGFLLLIYAIFALFKLL